MASKKRQTPKIEELKPQAEELTPEESAAVEGGNSPTNYAHLEVRNIPTKTTDGTSSTIVLGEGLVRSG